MADTTFSDVTGTPIVAAWLNDINDGYYNEQSSQTGSVARTLPQKLFDILHVKDFGAVGDGTTDDSSAIVNALNAGIATGCFVLFDGSKTYAINTETTFPAGAIFFTNGATFTTSLTTTGDTYLLTVADRVYGDRISITIPTGKQRDRCLLLDGDDINIGSVTLTSVDQQANTGADDGAVQILTGSRNTIGQIRVTNWDRAVVVAQTTGTTIDRVYVTSYVRGFYAYDNVNLRVNGGRIVTASANASNTAGHNGVLLGSDSNDAQRDCTFTNLTVENAGEHSVRIGGPYREKNIRFVNCVSRKSGGCGFKVLGTNAGAPLARNVAISFVNCVAEDVGTGVTSALNRAGFLIKDADDCQLIAPVIRKQDNSYSSGHCIVLDTVADILITNPDARDSANNGIIVYAVDGDISRITIQGGLCTGNAAAGIDLSVGPAKTMTGVEVNGLVLDTNTGLGFDVDVNGTMVDCFMNAKTRNNTGGMGACNSDDMVLDITTSASDVATTPLSGIVAVSDGSTVRNGTTLVLRKASAWTNL